MTLTAEKLISALRGVPEDCTLNKNQVGNLAIIDKDGFNVGFVDLQIGEVEMIVQEPVPA